MKTVVVDYGSGNLRSAAKALERVSTGRVEVTDRPGRLFPARIIWSCPVRGP